ncbi:MAG: phosphonate C-P lyase system protein PhnH [Roseiflexaceae bacterium]
MTTSYRAPSAFEQYSTITYRILLDCLARPGTINRISPATMFASWPEQTNSYALAACMTLLDQETSFISARNGQWLSSSHSELSWVQIRTNCRISDAPSAQFALLHDSQSAHLLQHLNQGSLTFPERSCTAFIVVDALSVGQPNWQLQGPGIKTHAKIAVQAPTGLAPHIIATRHNYPHGIDVFLVDSHGNCVGLPRTTRISPLA